MRRLLAALIVLVLALVAGAAWGHPEEAPTIWVDAHVQDAQLLYSVSGEAKILNPYMGLAKDAPMPARGQAADAALTKLAEWLAEHAPVSVDGRVLTLRPVEIIRPEGFEDDDGDPYIEARLTATIDGYPSRAEFVWHDYEHALWRWRQELPLMVRSKGDLRVAMLNPDERSFTWHDDAEFSVRPTVEAPPPPPPPVLPLPTVSIGLGAAGLVALLVFWRKDRRSVGFAVLVGALSAAGLMRGVAVVEVPSPFESKLQLPAQPQAAEIFERLHQNVYGAFQSSSEDEIYDRLATSVSVALLDELYGDVYESLILREEGGAIAVIDEVVVTERTVELPVGDSDVPQDRYEVEATWQVKCSVTHWAHRHRRINEYRARFEVRHDGYGWKIHSVDVLDERRQDVDPEYGIEPGTAPDDAEDASDDVDGAGGDE